MPTRAGARALAANLAACADAGVALVEQPLPDGATPRSPRIAHPIPVCADESVHDRAPLALAGKYDAVNIKLDKAGGLTEALAMAGSRTARIAHGRLHGRDLARHGAGGAAGADRALVDLDGPLLLAPDRPHGLRYGDRLVEPPAAALWG